MKLRSIATFLFLLLIVACEHEEPLQKGKLEFSVETLSKQGKKSSTEEEPLRYILVTIKDESNDEVYNRKKIELFSFDGNYLSEPLELPSGNFSITEFLVLNGENEVAYATPKENSRLGHLVADPLPMNFSITRDKTTKVTPQVIAIDEFNKAEDFGYSTFSFDVIETISFQLAAFVYDPTSENFKLTTSQLSISSEGTSLFNQNLPDSTYRVVVKDGYPSYQLRVTKNGYQPYEKTFSKEELLEYHTGAVLKIILNSTEIDLTNGLVGYYPFTGNANDLSPDFDNHGIVSGAALTTDRKGNPNSAYYFDGIDDYISVPDNSATDFEATHNFTISVWAAVKIPQATPGQAIFDIIRKWDGQNTNGYPYSISYLNQNSSQPNKFMLVRYDGQTCQNIPTLYSPTVNNMDWHHIIMLKKGNKLKFYLDNTLVSEITDTSTCTTTNNIHMTIGSRGQLVTFFNGKIDDIRFYNRALEASEIASLYTE